jgi:uncharacterized protein YecE (DUF72 family)
VIRIGTSGWNYPTGKGTWNGIFYPEGVRPKSSKKKGGFDDLAFYAEHFDTVEVNSSFYGVPTVETTKGWAARTPANFEFSPLYQVHPPRDVPEGDRQRSADLDRQDVDAFRAAITRSRAAAGALAQFPPASGQAGRPRLPGVPPRPSGYRVAVELRRVLRRRPSGRRLLGAHGAALSRSTSRSSAFPSGRTGCK